MTRPEAPSAPPLTDLALQPAARDIEAALCGAGFFTVTGHGVPPGGLQVRMRGVRVDVPPLPGALVANVGDMMQRWTNDRWPSTSTRTPRSSRCTPA